MQTCPLHNHNYHQGNATIAAAASSSSPYSSQLLSNISDYSKNSDKDSLSELKKRVIELEQKDSTVIQLNKRYKELLSLNDSITEEKFELQSELKKCKESLNKQILGLRDENESLQLVLNDKLQLNKKLNQDKDNIDSLLSTQIEKFNEQRTHLNRIIEEKTELEKIIQSLKEINTTQNRDLSKLHEENCLLNQLVDEKEASRVILREDNETLNQQFHDLNIDYQSSIDTIALFENEVKKSKCELEQYKEKITLLQSDLYDYHTENDCLKKDINALKRTLQSESNTRNHCERELDYLNKTMNDFVKELNSFKEQLKSEQIMNQKHFEEKNGLKKNMKMLIRQNDSLISVIEEIMVEEENIKMELNRRERIEYLIKENKLLIKKSMEENQINRINNNHEDQGNKNDSNRKRNRNKGRDRDTTPNKYYSSHQICRSNQNNMISKTNNSYRGPLMI